MKVLRAVFTGTLIAFAVAGLASIGRWVYDHRELARFIGRKVEETPVA